MNKKPANIFVLDSEPFMRELLRLRLEPLGAKVFFAEDAKEARKALTENKPSIVILDIMHPRLDSYKFVQWLKNQPAFRDTKVIVLTFKKRDPETFFLYNVWIEEYIEKPFIPDRLVSKVKEFLAADKN
jgi:DNA-binding response OmpR family regulator